MSLAAQDYPKVEVPLGFSFINVHPDIPQITSFNIFGGGGGFVYNFTPTLGVKADFMGYTQGNGLKTKLTNEGYVINGSVQGNLFTYLFGPQFKKHSGKLQPFGEALFGAAHSNTFGSIFNTIHGISGSSNNNAFAMAFGGGLDYVVGHNVQIRPVEVDYVYTRFGVNGTSYTGNQNNFRYVAGLDFTFGGAPPVPPTASCSASPTDFLAGAPVTATISTQNFNPKHTITYKWSSTGGKVSGTGTTGTVDTTGLAPGSYSVSATATDEKEKKNNVASCSASFTVKQPLPPVVSCSANPTTLAIGQPSTVTMSASDPQGWPLTYSWKATGGQLSGSGTSATLTATSTDAGNSITITGTATDDHGLSSSCTASVNVPTVSEKCTMIEDWGECTFEKNPKKPWRVDNDCKDVLDKLSLRLQQMPNGKLNIVGYTNQEEVIHEQTLGSQRSVNVKYYLTTDGPNKVDASRVQPRQGEAKGQATHFYFVPEGKLCGGQLEEGTVVDESQVQPQSRTAPASTTKHKKKAPAAAPAQ
jgi:hypothetical protein